MVKKIKRKINKKSRPKQRKVKTRRVVKKTHKIKGTKNNSRRVKIARSKSRGRLYLLNPDFEFFQELRALILKASPAEKDNLAKRISTLGRVKLAIISGIFLNYGDNFVFNPVADLFIVGDDINKRRLSSFLRSLEAEVGKEIKFGLMEKEEFDYRYGMFDRFVRVLLEGPHEKIINKLGL